MTGHARGWFGVAASHELGVGGVRPLQCFGRELVLFRGEDGVARVLDGHCPHLGAHLGRGGTVERNELRCPFHGWRWNGSGMCTAIGYAKRIPPNARTRAWPVREVNGLVLVHHDEEARPPMFEVPDVFEARGGAAAWRRVGGRTWRIEGVRAYEVLENAVDSAHFARVHGTGATTTTLDLDGDTARSRSVTRVRVGPIAIDTEIETVHHGPGFASVSMDVGFPLVVTSSTVPVDARSIETRTLCWLPRSHNPAPWLLAKLVIVPEAHRQFAEDIPIWTHKRWVERPVLCDGDGPIMRFRRWYARYEPSAHRACSHEADSSR